jgi:hypothetical protein
LGPLSVPNPHNAVSELGQVERDGYLENLGPADGYRIVQEEPLTRFSGEGYSPASR